MSAVSPRAPSATRSGAAPCQEPAAADLCAAALRPTTSTVIPNLQFFEDAQRWALAVLAARITADAWRAAAESAAPQHVDACKAHERRARRSAVRAMRWVRMYGNTALQSAAMRTPDPITGAPA